MTGLHEARQCCDPLRHGPVDDRFGGLVLGLADAAAVPALDQAGPVTGLTPPPRPPLPRLRCPAGGRSPPLFGVGQVHPVFGADRPAGDQQALVVGAGDGVGVDDAEVDPGDPPRVRRHTVLVDGDWDLGGDLDPEPAAVGEQGHRSDLRHRVGHGPVQAQLQRCTACCGRHPQPRPSRVNVPW